MGRTRSRIWSTRRKMRNFALQVPLGYDQTTLNLLGFFKDLGVNVGVMSGLINEITPPWVVLLIGGVMNFFGYFMMWLSVTNRIFGVGCVCIYV